MADLLVFRTLWESGLPGGAAVVTLLGWLAYLPAR
jgi:hypothetical protein